ncbi:MAG: OmpH family outer membrane protein [Bryobacteraceae bacterium]|nr:OmpH family outer membrane protein [Bryobacteraceae bacterium]
MKLQVFRLPVALCCLGSLAAFAQAPAAKVGTVSIQQAIIGTKDGQKAVQQLQTKIEPKRKELEAKQAQIAQMEDQQRKSANTASADTLRKLATDIEQNKKSLQRMAEDAEAESQQEQNKLLNELGGRIMQVLDKYSRDNGFTLILDVSNQQTSPVLWAANGVDITADIIKLYDSSSPSTMAPAPAAAPAAKPAAPAAAPPAKKVPGAK